MFVQEATLPSDENPLYEQSHIVTYSLCRGVRNADSAETARALIFDSFQRHVCLSQQVIHYIGG